ncbi:MAG: sugar transferase [Chloroflexi bacterium]|nr:sugar transferase [Chloroflexota bacterium]
MAKRSFDLAVASPALLVLSPFLLLIAVLIKLGSPGPVLHKGERVGKGGQPFHILKFRSMVMGSDAVGPQRTAAGDSRITRVGHFLRKWKLDELPQLINVIRGEMSLVGPRPESPYYARHFTPEQRRVLEATPGITGLAQLAFRREEETATGDDLDESYLRDILPHKLEMDLQYIDSASIILDLRIILRTLGSLLSRFAGG